jgi:hypothetical protein
MPQEDRLVLGIGTWVSFSKGELRIISQSTSVVYKPPVSEIHTGIVEPYKSLPKSISQGITRTPGPS